MTAPVVDAQPIVSAIKAALAGDVLLAEGVKPKNVGSKSYVVAFFDAGTVGNRSLVSRDGWALVGTFHAAGLSPDSVRGAIRKLRAAILGLHLTEVAGRTLLMPEHLSGMPMQRDDDADPPLFIQIDEWRFRTT